jgi:hypothetical protein
MTQRRAFLSILAAAGLLLLVQQLADLAPILSETDLATPSGRVRMVTILAGRASPILLADVFLVWSALALSQGVAIRVFGALHLMLGALMVVAAPFFLRDAGRLANAISGDEVAAYRVIVARTLGMLTVLGASALLAGRAIWSMGRVTPAGV